MQKLSGSKLAKIKISELKQKIELNNKKPCLAIVTIGHDTSSEIYVEKKIKTAHECGILTLHIKLAEDLKTKEVISEINKLNNDPKVHGIIIQLPLPKNLDTEEILQSVKINKDADGLNPENFNKLISKPFIVPCTPLGIINLLNFYKISIKSKNVVILGRSRIVGLPLAILMLNLDATVTICHSKTKNLSEILKNADIVISATGQKNIIDPNSLNKKIILVDVGIIREVNAKIRGDVDHTNLDIQAYTPVPGGVGPMTVISLMENVYKLFLLAEK